jgi:hypothetical protein
VSGIDSAFERIDALRRAFELGFGPVDACARSEEVVLDGRAFDAIDPCQAVLGVGAIDQGKPKIVGRKTVLDYRALGMIDRIKAKMTRL